MAEIDAVETLIRDRWVEGDAFASVAFSEPSLDSVPTYGYYIARLDGVGDRLADPQFVEPHSGFYIFEDVPYEFIVRDYEVVRDQVSPSVFTEVQLDSVPTYGYYMDGMPGALVEKLWFMYRGAGGGSNLLSTQARIGFGGAGAPAAAPFRSYIFAG